MTDYRIVDPSQAKVDLDAMSLLEYTLSPSPDDAVAGDVATVTASFLLVGGLGRVTVMDGRSVLVNRVEKLAFSADFPNLTVEQRQQMGLLLSRWQTTGMPLRFLDFISHALLLEDSDNLVIIPAGHRDLLVAGNGEDLQDFTGAGSPEDFD